MASPQIVVDDPTIFATITRILDVMLRLVDPQNPLVVLYLVSIDPNVSIGVLPSKGAKGYLKASKVPKKNKAKNNHQMRRRKLRKKLFLRNQEFSSGPRSQKKPHDFPVR